MKRTILISAMVMTISASALQLNAQRGPHGRMGMMDPPDIAACDPDLVHKRIEFDKELSKSEKATITEFRERLPEIKEELHQKFVDGRGDCDGEPSGRMRTEMEKQFAPIIDIAKSHDESLEVIATEHLSRMKDRYQDGDCPRAKGGKGYGRGNPDERGKGYGGQRRGGKQGNPDRGFNPEDRGRMFGVHFLLMETEK